MAANTGLPGHLVDDWRDVQPGWIANIRNVAVTAGASAPEYLVEDLIAFLRQRGFGEVEELELVDEDVHFSLPAELARAGAKLTSIALP